MDASRKIMGLWYDGRSSASLAAELLQMGPGRLTVLETETGRTLADLPAAEVKITARLGDTPRFISFGQSGKFETEDNPAVDSLVRRLGSTKPPGGLVHALESRWRYVLAAVVLTGLLVWWAVVHGLPWAGGVVASQLPPVVYSQVDSQTMAALDKTLFSPSRLGQATRDRLDKHFAPVLADHPDLDLKVTFRRGGRVGANAFALPGGTIVFTDEMVNLARDYDQLAAVLAHEIGHVHHRHAMRNLVQNSLLGFILLALTGDVSSTSNIFLGLPVMLTERHYSRTFERQADEYALNYMKKSGLETHHFADIMKLLKSAAASQGHKEKGGLNDYLSTHPRTDERIKAFE